MRNNMADNGYLYIKTYSPYVEGIVGQDIELSLWQKLKIMFSKGISVVFIGEHL